MLLNDMASVLRNAGVVVEEAPGWIGHNHGAMASVESIIIHHTAGAATGDYPSYNVVRTGRSGLPGPLAQLGVGRSGKVYVFSNGVSYHAGVVHYSWMDNQHSIGLEVESVGTGALWPDVQVHGTARAVAALCKRYGLTVDKVLGHKEVCSPAGRKVDPVGIPGDMPAFRALVQQYINGDFDIPETPEEEDDNMVKFVKGNLSAHTFKVEYTQDAPSIAVRTYVPNANEPGYKIFLAGGGSVLTVPQADIDAVPYKSGTMRVDGTVAP